MHCIARLLYHSTVYMDQSLPLFMMTILFIFIKLYLSCDAVNLITV
jgi:hypothetical protein